MTNAQRKAIIRIIRFYREDGGRRRSVRIEELKDSRLVRLKIKTRWDGREDQIGALYDKHGCFWIGPKGKIELIYADSSQHVAFMIRARLFRGRELKMKPSQYRGKKTHRVWELADQHPTLTRTQVITMAVAEGINRNTASTQYHHWNRMQKACGRK
jgi:hypothetical protein